ncbi:hypothetical protein ACIPM2_36310 [Streptomyces sp. NPDC086081]|uniref:hypothetical protein n=1 Tax=unclassified Streptomyces TaxID=2593676 RepID=UPI0037D7884C
MVSAVSRSVIRRHKVAATVREAAEALRGAGGQVEEVSIPAFERDNPLELFYRQPV